MKAVILFVILCCAASPVYAGDADKVFERVRASVVTITTWDDQNNIDGEGSGVVVGSGQVVTNCHVVQDAVAFKVRSGDQEYPAAVVSGDIKRDLCRLEVKGLTAPAVTMRDSAGLKSGEPVYIIGNPLGFGLAVGSGLVSAIRRTGNDISIFTSAPTSPGSSGGGLFDTQGRLIGITTARYLGAQNFNMALPAEWVIDLIKNGTPWKTPLKVEPDPDWAGMAETLRVAGNWVKLEEWARQWKEWWPVSTQADQFLGLSLYNQKKYHDAETILSSALKKNPQDAASYAYRGLVRRIRGDREGAFSDIRQAQALHPSEGYYYRVLAVWLQEDKVIEEAVTAIETAIRLVPGEWECWEILGELRQRQKRFQEAEEAYNKVLWLKPGEHSATTNLAALQVSLGKSDAARRTLSKGSTSETGYAADANTWSHIGATEGKNHRYAESDKAYRKALEMNPNLAEAWMGLGTTLRNTMRHTEAEKALRKAAELNPRLGGAWLNLGAILNERGDKAGAMDAYEKATRAAPSLAQAWYSLGALHHERRDMAAAAKAFAEAARLEPENVIFLAYLGETQIRSGQADKAIVALNKAENLDPKNEIVLQSLALYYGNYKGDTERALEYVERGLTINSASPVFWSSKGYSLLKLRRYSEAEQALDTALRLQPDFVNGWINLGEVHMRQNQLGKAIDALNKALQLSPSSLDARLYIVQCFMMSRQFDKAQSHMGQLLQQEPKFPPGWAMQTSIFLAQNKRLDALNAYGKLKSLDPGLAKTLREKYLAQGSQYELPN